MATRLLRIRRLSLQADYFVLFSHYKTKQTCNIFLVSHVRYKHGCCVTTAVAVVIVHWVSMIFGPVWALDHSSFISFGIRIVFV